MWNEEKVETSRQTKLIKKALKSIRKKKKMLFSIISPSYPPSFLFTHIVLSFSSLAKILFGSFLWLSESTAAPPADCSNNVLLAVRRSLLVALSVFEGEKSEKEMRCRGGEKQERVEMQIYEQTDYLRGRRVSRGDRKEGKQINQ